MPRVAVHQSWATVDPVAWDALVGDGSPFLESAFLFALETTGCATPDTGWHPRPVLVHDDDDRLVAAAPAWVKTHSMGEFVYDHGWAQAAAQAGIKYYPKLVVAVPFSPVTGQRLLVRPGEDRDAWLPVLFEGLSTAAKGTAGVHVLFPTEDEARELETYGAFSRLQYQFHWHNRRYATHDDFLATLRSPARKKLKRERREVSRLAFERVVAPSEEQMALLGAFYASTCDKHVWGNQYLTDAFFRHLARAWGHRVLAVLARDGDRVVAGAWEVFKGDRLYGRTWGCAEEIPFLHFEVCYHQGMEFCIERGLSVFEPGHGGEHKYRRGFVPVVTWSSHWLFDPRAHQGFRSFAQREADAVRDEVAQLAEAAPYRDDTEPAAGSGETPT